MTNKTKAYRLKANADYEAKIKRKIFILRPQDEALAQAIEGDKDKFNPLVRRLLCEHYCIEQSEE